MKLTYKQEQGLKIAVERYKKHEKYTIISGYAGTGKSTLVSFIIDVLPIKEENVCFATYTGKAAQVLAQKGNKNVSTLHKLLYDSYPRPDGTFYRKPKAILDYNVIVIDEISMVPKSLIDLLLSHNIYMIGLGDPFQLPPILKDEDNHLLDNPHIFLDQIMRQAEESEIIRLSMQIRNYQPLSYNKGTDAIIMKKENINTGILTWADQILVATNKTRININTQMRKLLNHKSKRPEEGDKVICLRNYWGVLSNQNEYDLINGTIGYLQNVTNSSYKLPVYVGGNQIEKTNAILTIENNDFYNYLNMDTYMILTGKKCIDNKTAFKLTKNPNTKNLVPLEFTYGYAITGHKAQGSQWDKVTILEENFPFDKEEHARWLYTCVTRSIDKVVLIR